MNRSKHPLYAIWSAMRYRCQSENCTSYPNYGGRGIQVCDRWDQSFEVFCTDMGAKPTPDHQLDRIDNNGNYEPGNCRWVERKVNVNNRRKKVYRKNTPTIYIQIDREVYNRFKADANSRGVTTSKALYNALTAALKAKR